MSPGLTIVIVNWNGGKLLMRCLESIRAQAHLVDLSVIVVDNDSSDGSRQAATDAFPEYRVLNSGSNLGFGRANNLARPLVRTPLVLFLNPDTEITEGALQGAMNCLLQHPDVGALGCKMLEPNGTVHQLGLQWTMSPLTVLFELLLVTDSSRRYLHWCLPTIDPARSSYVKKLYGGFLLVRREVLDMAGWFDDRYFMYGEDADLSLTVRRLGWKLYYCANAVIVHVGGGLTTHAPSAFSYLMKQESINKLILKYQGRAAAMCHRVVVCFGGLVRLGAVWFGSIIAKSRRDDYSQARWKASLFKQRQLVLWALGLRRATVPLAHGYEPK